MAGSFSRTGGNEKGRQKKKSPEKPKDFGTWLKLGDEYKIILDVLRLKNVLLKRTKIKGKILE